MDALTKSILEVQESDIERLARYQRYWRYYHGRAFFVTNDDEAAAVEEYLRQHKMFKDMRDIFSCVSRVVDANARFVMKRELQLEAEEDIKQHIDELWERSNIQREKYKLVRFGANLGDAYLYLLPREGDNVPMMYVANTEDFTPYYDQHDRTKMLAARQSYTFMDGDTARDWSRIFWPDRVETYVDEVLQQEYSFPHEFGIVPVFHVRNIDIGERFGQNSWVNVQHRLDTLNELASYARSILYRYANPELKGKNVIPPADGRLRRGYSAGGTPITYLQGDGDLEPLEFGGNAVPHLLEYMRTVYDDIKDDLPELALAQLRGQTGLSGYSVQLQMMDAVAKIDELRGNYGDVLELANSVAVRAALRSKAPLEDFANRVVFEDVLPEDPTEVMQVEEGERRMGILSRREQLRRRGLTDEEIDERLQEVDDDRASEGYGLGRLFDELDDQRRGGDDGGDD